MLSLIKQAIYKILLFYFIFLYSIGKCIIEPDEPQQPIQNNIKKTLDSEVTSVQNNYSKNQILVIKRKSSHSYEKTLFNKYRHKIKNIFTALARRKSFKRKNHGSLEEGKIKKSTTLEKIKLAAYSEYKLDNSFIKNVTRRRINNSTEDYQSRKKKRDSMNQVHNYVKSVLPDFDNILATTQEEDSDDSDEYADDFFCKVVDSSNKKSLILSYYQPEDYATKQELFYSNQYLAKISNFFMNYFVDSNIKYIGYYTPYYLMLHYNDNQEMQQIPEEDEQKDIDEDDYVHISLIIKQAIIAKMIQQLGRATHKKMQIPLHNHYITGIYLGINIFNKLQFVVVYDNGKDIMHNIKFIKDYNTAINFMLNIYNKNMEHSNNYLSDFYNIQKNTLVNLHEQILSFTDETVYGLILIEMKIPENHFLNLTKLNFILYAFESILPQKQTIDDLIYKYDGYYIAIITVLIANNQYTRYYQIKENFDDAGSELFPLFKEQVLQEIINNEQQSDKLEDTNFIVIISLMFSYKEPNLMYPCENKNQLSVNDNCISQHNKPDYNTIYYTPRKVYIKPNESYDVPMPILRENDCEDQETYDTPRPILRENNCEDLEIYDDPWPILRENDCEDQEVYDIPPTTLRKSDCEDQEVYDIPPATLRKSDCEDQEVYDIPPTPLEKSDAEDQGLYDISSSTTNNNFTEIQITHNDSLSSYKELLADTSNVAEATMTNTNNHSDLTNKAIDNDYILEIKNINNFIANTNNTFKITIPLFFIFNVNNGD